MKKQTAPQPFAAAGPFNIEIMEASARVDQRDCEDYQPGGPGDSQASKKQKTPYVDFWDNSTILNNKLIINRFILSFRSCAATRTGSSARR